MTERIKKLTELTLSGKTFANVTKTAYSESDLSLPKQEMESKRICEYILNQEPVLTEYSALTGFFNFDGSVVGDAFRRGGHTGTAEAMRLFYTKTIDNLSSFEWQHATADYSRILNKGISGIIDDIHRSMKKHSDPDARRSEGQFCKNTVYFARDMPYSCFFRSYAVLRISSITSINSFSAGMSISPTAVK